MEAATADETQPAEGPASPSAPVPGRRPSWGARLKVALSSLSGSSQGRTDGESEDIELPMLPNTDPLSPPTSPVVQDEQQQPAKDQRSFPAQQPAADRRSIVARIFHFCLGNWEKALVLAVIITLIVLVSVKGFKIFGALLRWFQKQNNWRGWGIFLAIYCANVALFLPGVVLILGAGFVFGFPKGLLAVWVGGGVGQPLAFLLASLSFPAALILAALMDSLTGAATLVDPCIRGGLLQYRYLLRDAMSGYMRAKWKKWDVLDRAIQEEGWKLLLLLRLSPAVPYNVLNIAMALTGMNFWVFTITSFFGIIPECSILCYFGSLSEDISSVIDGKGGAHGPIKYVLMGVTCFFMITAVVWSTFVVRRAFRRAEAEMQSVPAADSHRDSGNDDSGLDDEEALLSSRVLARRTLPGRADNSSSLTLHSDDSPWSPHESPHSGNAVSSYV